eukprot:404128_1
MADTGSIFRTRLSELCCKKLIFADSSVPIQPFVKITFDSSTVRQTIPKSDGGENPVWDRFDTWFQYKPNEIEKQMILFEVLDSRDSSLIGRVSVELMILVTGPVLHDLELSDHLGRGIGRILFRCEMEEIASVLVSLKRVTVTGLPSQESINMPFLSYSVSTNPSVFVRSPATLPGSELVFDRPPHISFCSSLKELLMGSITFSIKNEDIRDESGPNKTASEVAEFELKFAKIYEFAMLKELSFKLESRTSKGSLYGLLFFARAPKYIQMLEGVHTESGIKSGLLAFQQVPKPSCVIEYSAQPPSDVETAVAFLASMTSSVDGTPSETAKGDKASTSGVYPVLAPPPDFTEDEPHVPGDISPGWEEQATPDGKKFYVNHITKQTQWERPEGIGGLEKEKGPKESNGAKQKRKTSKWLAIDLKKIKSFEKDIRRSLGKVTKDLSKVTKDLERTVRGSSNKSKKTRDKVDTQNITPGVDAQNIQPEIGQPEIDPPPQYIHPPPYSQPGVGQPGVCQPEVEQPGVDA